MSVLTQFASQLTTYKLNAYLVTNDVNIRYLTQFPASESWLLVLPEKSYYITDFRYILEARAGLKGVSVYQHKNSLIFGLCELLLKHKVRKLGFDTRHVSLARYQQLRKACPSATKLVAKNNLIGSLRECKTKAEVDQIRQCLKLNLAAYRYIQTYIKPGISERELLLKLESFVKSKGAGFSFSPIIASGPNSCFPHAKVTDRKLKNNEPLLIDMGIDIEGYKSDLTRMFFLGRIPPLVKKVNDIVATAQSKAIAKISAGVKAADVDKEARNYLAEKKLAQYFGHSLGHGVGLDIHEAPRLSTVSSAVLQPGMVVTVEPGVYLPNKFGIRIEDMVLVTPQGCEVLSR